MVKRLNESEKAYIERQFHAGIGCSQTADDLSVSVRHVRHLYARIRSTGTIQPPRSVGRPDVPITDDQKDLVIDAVRNEGNVGVRRTAKRLHGENHNISYYAVYVIMKEQGMVTSSEAKSKRRSVSD